MGTKQDYQTPPEFIKAVEKRFGTIEWDLAAHAENTQASRYFSEESDSLKQNWHIIGGLLWLNPPFKFIKPWAAKCKAEAELGAKIAMLVPASIGTDWFAESVHGHAMVLGLHPRITFVGTAAPYPKDLMLCLFGPAGGVEWSPGFGLWRWK